MKRAFLAAGGALVASFMGGVLVLCLCFSSSAFAAADGWASQNDGTTGGGVSVSCHYQILAGIG